MRPRIRLSVVLLAAATIAGCGGSEESAPKAQATPAAAGEQRGILDTIDALQTASSEGDGRRICDELFTSQLKQSVEQAAGRSCSAEARERLFTPSAQIAVSRRIRVDGDRGSLVIREQNGNLSELSMRREAGRWRIDRVTPQEP